MKEEEEEEEEEEDGKECYLGSQQAGQGSGGSHCQGSWGAPLGHICTNILLDTIYTTTITITLSTPHYQHLSQTFKEQLIKIIPIMIANSQLPTWFFLFSARDARQNS